MFGMEAWPQGRLHSFWKARSMGSKLSGFLIIFGSFLILLGLCCLPAGFSNKDQTILGAGICAIVFGSMWVSGGIYLKASSLKAEIAAGGAKPQPQAVRGGCDLCGTDSPVVHCRVHQLHICGDCVSRHYDFRACVYVPSTRRSVPAKQATRSARAGR